MLEDLKIINEIPNYPILAANIDIKSGAKDPKTEGFAIDKVKRCDELIERVSGDNLLVKAYKTKRGKELIEAKTIFLFTSQPTPADLFWALELMRLEDLKVTRFLSDKDFMTLQDYYQHLCETPALQQAVTNWPGARIS